MTQITLTYTAYFNLLWKLSRVLTSTWIFPTVIMLVFKNVWSWKNYLVIFSVTWMSVSSFSSCWRHTSTLPGAFMASCLINYRDALPIPYRRLYVQTYLVLLRFADIAFFYKLKVCGNPASSRSIGAFSPTACAHFMSLCHILVILAIFRIL
jgi:hypothetical protein